MVSTTTSETASVRGDDESCEDQFLPPPMAWFEDSSRGSDAVTRTSVEPDPERVEPPQVVAFPKIPIRSTATVGAPFPSPSWKEISSQVLPAAARELLSSSMNRLYYTARVSYARGRWVRKYSELGNNTGGYFRPSMEETSLPKELLDELPPFSSLSWVDRQLVREWRTYLTDSSEEEEAASNEEIDFDRARTLVPIPQARPMWQNSESCASCRKTFGPTRLRHHCRMCGKSFCNPHSSQTHKLPHLGYDPDVPERVCDACKLYLLEQNLAERVAWRLARCRDYKSGVLTPYFETGVETMEEVALRISQAALTLAKSIPLGAQATVAVETVDVLRKHGLNGIYTIMLRQEFLAAADLLRKALGINPKAWPLSVHELSAAIFYALAQHRALRGLNPEREHLIHSIRNNRLANVDSGALLADEAEVYKMGEMNVAEMITLVQRDVNGAEVAKELKCEDIPFSPVCDPVSNSELASLIFYAPIALNFIYSEKEVDMQLLAAQQGWRLLYAYMQQDAGRNATDRPVSALFVHEEQKVACIAVRGTATIHDVITDIRQVPVPFPENEDDSTPSTNNRMDEDWTAVFRGRGVAVCGMAGAAINLYREHIDSIMFLAKEGYRIRLTGHSLGGGVATLLGVLLRRDLGREEKSSETAPDFGVRVYAYGTPPCVDSRLASLVESFVTTVVLHDDVIPRLTPMSCRGLLKHLLHIKETWVKAHLPDDLKAITDRARTAWAPKWRGSFTLSTSSSIKRYCKNQIQLGKRKILSVKGKILSDYVQAEKGNLEFDVQRGNFSSLLTEESGCSDHNEDSCSDSGNNENDMEETKLLVDYLGGTDYRSEGMIIDGEEFFDTEDNLLDDEDSAASCSNDNFDDALCGSILEEQGMAASTTTLVKSDVDKFSGPEVQCRNGETADSEGETPGAVVLEEIALPKMFVPGKIVHIYSHRGVYRAAHVPRSFRELRRISLAGNMLADHKCKAYYEALLEVRTVREAPESPPVWTAFDEDDTCSCCASRFTWASTSDSEAQEARDKHNCRSCGTLVCDPCSKNKIPLPSIGITVPARVCDRCYNDINGVFTGAVRNTMSFLAEGESEQVRVDEDEVPEKPVRERERRSAVVDELASRIHAPALRCS